MDGNTFLTPRGVLGKRPRIGNSSDTPVSGSFSDDGNGSLPRRKPKKPLSRMNPFEKDLLGKLHLPVWSPSVLQCSVDTPPQTDWTINQIALINPHNIEESPSTRHHFEDELEPHEEHEAQKNIQQFFDNFHVPSPAPSNPPNCTDKSVNTELSFPVDLPFHVLEMLMSHSQIVEGSSVVREGPPKFVPDAEAHNLLNNSSVLRRKLDFSMETTLDDSAHKSDDSDVEDRRCHGAFIMSP